MTETVDQLEQEAALLAPPPADVGPVIDVLRTKLSAVEFDNAIKEAQIQQLLQTLKAQEKALEEFAKRIAQLEGRSHGSASRSNGRKASRK